MIFASMAPKFWEMGFSVLPIQPGTKAPTIQGWSEWCYRIPTEPEMDSFINKYPDWGIGLALGGASGIEAIDIDTEDPELLTRIKSVTPYSPVAKKGKKGITYFFRHSGLPSRKWKIGTTPIIEFLSTGNQTVLPPTIHPETGSAYYYVGEQDLLNVDLEDIPRVDWGPIFKEYDKIVSEFYKPNKEKASGGRNDKLKAIVAKMLSDGRTLEEIVDRILLVDKNEHSPPLFEDPKEFPSRTSTPAKNAKKFAASVIKSINNNRDRQGLDPEKPIVLTEEDTLFPSKRDGFFIESISNGRISIKPDYYGLAEWLKYKYNFVHTPSCDYIYNGLHYHSIDESFTANLIMKETKGKVTPVQIDQFRKIIKAFNYKEDFRDHSYPGLLNIKTGILDIQSREIIPHSPKYYFQYCLPHEYEPNATCPLFEEFMDKIMIGKKDLIKTIQQYIGYTLYGGNPWLHKAICFYGDGRNGKSTLLKVIQKLIGKENYSEISLSRIGLPFSTVLMEGKIANIVEESPSDKIDSEIFKNYVAGGSILASHKGKPEFTFPCNARFFFATNDLPKFGDTSRGATERLIFIPFDKYFSDEEKIYGFENKLYQEIPGILNWAIDGFNQLKETKSITIGESAVELTHEYKTESDSVYAFFHEKITPTWNDAHSFTSADAYYKYVLWCEKGGLHKVNVTTFQKRVNRIVREICRLSRQEFEATRLKYPARGYKFFFMDL